jgi:hypothetical protein
LMYGPEYEFPILHYSFFHIPFQTFGQNWAVTPLQVTVTILV